MGLLTTVDLGTEKGEGDGKVRTKKVLKGTKERGGKGFRPGDCEAREFNKGTGNDWKSGVGGIV